MVVSPLCSLHFPKPKLPWPTHASRAFVLVPRSARPRGRVDPLSWPDLCPCHVVGPEGFRFGARCSTLGCRGGPCICLCASHCSGSRKGARRSCRAAADRAAAHRRAPGRERLARALRPGGEWRCVASPHALCGAPRFSVGEPVALCRRTGGRASRGSLGTCTVRRHPRGPDAASRAGRGARHAEGCTCHTQACRGAAAPHFGATVAHRADAALCASAGTRGAEGPRQEARRGRRSARGRAEEGEDEPAQQGQFGLSVCLASSARASDA